MIIMFEEEKGFNYIMAGEGLSFPSLQEYLEHCGKWLIYGEKRVIDSMVPRVRELVGSDNILQAKYSRGPALEVPEGFVKGRDHVMIVYSDDRKNNAVKEVLERELKVKKMFWKYDRETLMEMHEGGKELPEHIISSIKMIEGKDD